MVNAILLNSGTAAAKNTPGDGQYGIPPRNVPGFQLEESAAVRMLESASAVDCDKACMRSYPAKGATDQRVVGGRDYLKTAASSGGSAVGRIISQGVITGAASRSVFLLWPTFLE